MLRYLLEDCRRYSTKRPSLARMAWIAIINAGFRAMVLFRVGHACRKRRLRLAAALCERVMHHLCHCWMSTAAQIGPGFLIAHVWGFSIGGGVIIGSNCDVRHRVSMGGNYGKRDKAGRTQPTLGDNVSVGAGAMILGPVKVGTNAVIGANSVVTRDVPENMIVAGIPAKVIRERWPESERKL